MLKIESLLKLNRRNFFFSLGAILLPSISFAKEETKLNLFIGTYKSETNNGIIELGYDYKANSVSIIDSKNNIENASFAVKSEKLGMHYISSENDNGSIGVFKYSDNKLVKLSEVKLIGRSPCHLALNKDETLLAAANYMSGSVNLFAIKKDGSLKLLNTYTNKGTGPNKSRQEAAHAHWVGFHNNYLYSVDLGTDEVLKFAINNKGLGKKQIAYKANPGNGPRHLAFHPSLSRAYLVNELSNSLTILEVKPDGNLQEIETIKSLPEEFKQHSQAAHISINKEGTNLYFSNRGINDILVFALDKKGDAKIIQRVSSGGDWPRFFKLFEENKKILIANQNSGEIISYDIEIDGTLTNPKNLVNVPKPIFIGIL